jgi:hypothetical protein
MEDLGGTKQAALARQKRTIDNRMSRMDWKSRVIVLCLTDRKSKSIKQKEGIKKISENKRGSRKSKKKKKKKKKD